MQGTDEIPIERGQTTYKTKVDGLNKVSKAGDTMTGNLILKGTYGDGEIGQGDNLGTRLNYQDKNGTVIGRITTNVLNSGTQGVQIQSTRSGVNHRFGIYIDSSGNRLIDVSSADPWRKALGIGQADGSLPLTIAQGGTGADNAASALSNLGIPFGCDRTNITTGNSNAYQLPNSQRGVAFISGSASGNASKDIVIYNTTSGGNLTFVQLRSPSGITVTGTSNPPVLTVANGSGASINVLRIYW